MGNIENIIIICGGSSSEREISLQSGEGVFEALKELNYNVQKKDFNDLDNLNELKEYDIVFIALHGEEGESGLLQAELESLGISFTGPNSNACMQSWNKSISKDVIRNNGLKTPSSINIKNSEAFKKRYQDIPFEHFFLKPAMEGSSVNIFEVKNEQDYEQALSKVNGISQEFILEEAIKHKEYTVSIIGDEIFPPIEIKTVNSFYDYDAKYLCDSTQLIQAEGDEATIKKIKDFALNSYHALGCSGWARVDILQDSNHDLYFLELNSSPGMTSHSCVPKSASFLGLDYKQVVNKIINASIQ